MEASSWALTVMAWLAALAVLSKIFTFKRHQPKFPPGPKPWPIIGNLNLIGALPHQSLHKLSQKYGPIMHLKLGSVSVVVAASPEMAKQFLKTHDHIFASRPQPAAGKYISYNYSDILWAPYGPYFRQARKIYMSEVFTPKRLESYEYIRVEERSALLSRLHALSGNPIKVKEHLVLYTLSVISRVALGKKYFSESESESETSAVTFKEFLEMLDEWFVLNSDFNVGDWIPWLNFLDLQGFVKRMKALSKRFDRFHDHVFDDHKAKRGAGDFVPNDMVDLMLQLADDPNTDVKLTYDNLKGLTQDLIIGATDTAATSVEWTMSELLKQPHLISKATEELDRVIGKDRWVEEKDIPQLPYIDAIVKETMRKHPPAVMLAPHFALEDCTVVDYDIRKGSIVLINTWGMGRDPLIWDAPEEFRPERFLGKAIDVKGQYFELLPFGSGRRMCPGYSLGLKMVYSTLANMLHGFEWKLPDNMKPEDLTMEEVYGLATSRKFPVVAVTKPRLPLHLY
ncbi:trimethyltridecatetraene synthase-like [Corylus avellana]|uniref:trimethyltridecatetraene synthase-like n=1 Tax=Corylus avellana TaxID=13451 RepID=UPI00286B58EB|nr:trimethyltridecatetraene synthase-like [Corylus avellana]